MKLNIFEWFKEKKNNKPVSFVCKQCKFSCAKCDIVFCYSCHTQSGVCPKCGADQNAIKPKTQI